MRWEWTFAVVMAAGLLLVPVGHAGAQPAPATSGSGEGGPLPIAAQGDQVVVKREAANIIAPEKYRVNLALKPHQVVVLSAPCDAVVRQVVEKVNNLVKPQSEVIRLENTTQKLQLQRAQAEYKLAALEQKGATTEDQKAIAAAKLEASKAELDLAQFLFDQTSIRTPINGEVRRVFVVEGQYVRAGDPLAEVGDSSKLAVEIPVERNAVTKGAALPIKIEAQEVSGTVSAIVPLSSEFDALRDLFESITSAVVVFENADGKLKSGQTVYVPLIPRNPVLQLASGAVLNASDGTRRVQVLRNGVVRDVPVQLMGPVGTDRLYVSGPFVDLDEVIYDRSHQLPDGFQLRPLAAAAASAGAGANPQPTRPNVPAGTGF